MFLQASSTASLQDVHIPILNLTWSPLLIACPLFHITRGIGFDFGIRDSSLGGRADSPSVRNSPAHRACLYDTPRISLRFSWCTKVLGSECHFLPASIVFVYLLLPSLQDLNCPAPNPTTSLHLVSIAGMGRRTYEESASNDPKPLRQVNGVCPRVVLSNFAAELVLLTKAV